MEKINLKSNLLIKLFGKDEVSLEELQEKEEFVLDGQGIAFTEEEIENIKSDLAYVFEELKERVCELSIGNCPDSMRDYVIKNAPTTEIYFEGRDELTENEVDVSDEFKKSCGDIETEYDLFDYIKTAQSIDLKPLITLKDIDLIQNYANISDFKIKIENEQEYQALLQIAGDENVEILTNKDFLQKLFTSGHEVPANLDFHLEIDNMSQLSEEELSSSSDKVSIKSIYIPAKSDETMQEKDSYSIEEYTMLKDKVDSILSQVDSSKPELDRFMQIYQILGETIEYEYDDDGDPAKRNEAHNLKGRIVRGKMCV